MGLIHILIVEDDVVTATHLQQQLMRVGYTVAEPVGNANDALAYFKQHQPDLVLMDIELQTGNGIEVAIEMRTQRVTPIIFLTSHFDPVTVSHAKKAFPANFLRKPHNEIDLLLAIDFALHEFSATSKNEDQELHLHLDSVFIKQGTGTWVKQTVDEVLFLEGMRQWSRIVTTNAQFVLSKNIKQVASQLPQTSFIRVHRSYVVNLSRIEKIEGNMLTLQGASELNNLQPAMAQINGRIPIGENYKANLLQKFRKIS